MTERLSTLLHDEADHLAIPSAPAGAVLAQGRKRVRRRRAGLASIATAAVVLAGAGIVTDITGGRDAATAVILDPPSSPTASDWAVAQGSIVHLANGETIQVPGKVKALYYTSAGILVRAGASSATDAPDSHYWLAHPDGTLTDFELSLGDRVPGSDPALAYLAYAEKGSDSTHWTVVIRDVRSGDVVRRIPIEGRFTWGGWVAPPVSLSGEHVYVGLDGTLLDVWWRSGETTTTSIQTHMPETRGSREVVSHDRVGAVQIVQMPAGRVVRTFTYDPKIGFAWSPQLSTDGTHVAMLPYAQCTGDGSCSYEGQPTRIIDLATGTSRTVSLEYGAFGWSATGRLLIVDGLTVRSCDPDTLQCETTDVELDGTGPLRVSGNDNES